MAHAMNATPCRKRPSLFRSIETIRKSSKRPKDNATCRENANPLRFPRYRGTEMFSASRMATRTRIHTNGWLDVCRSGATIYKFPQGPKTITSAGSAMIYHAAHAHRHTCENISRKNAKAAKVSRADDNAKVAKLCRSRCASR